MCGTDLESQRIHVVCGEGGDPLRTYANQEQAEDLLEYWRGPPMRVRGSIKTLDLVASRSVDTDTDQGGEAGE